MASPAAPIDIASSRQNSNSPRNQQSNLTSQLQRPRIDVREASNESVNTATYNMGRPDGGVETFRNRQESVGMLGTTPYGARSIPVRDGYRRESNAFSGSLMGGMSWGGISMGSFVRDE